MTLYELCRVAKNGNFIIFFNNCTPLYLSDSPQIEKQILSTQILKIHDRNYKISRDIGNNIIQKYGGTSSDRTLYL